MRILGFLGAFLLLIAYGSVFTIHQTQQALVLQFGDPRQVITEPGLKFKMPFVQNVILFDKRILDLDSPPEEVIASDQKRIVVDAYARYRITNPLLFYQTLQNRNGADSRMKSLLTSNMRSVLGKQPLQAFVRDNRSELMGLIKGLMKTQTADFGINIIDVRIRRADLPEENSQAIFRRMQTERQQEAAEIRAIGQQDSREIRATADKEVAFILASAYRDSEIIRSQGDGCRNRIFAYAFGRDPDFFAFYRSMEAYKKSLSGDKTSLILSPQSKFFNFFLDPNTKGRSQRAERPDGGQQKLFQIKDALRKQICAELTQLEKDDKKKEQDKTNEENNQNQSNQRRQTRSSSSSTQNPPR